jgi:hypothetical protein
MVTGEDRAVDLGFAPTEQIQRVSFGSRVFVATASAGNRARTVIVAADNGPLPGVFSQFVCADGALCTALFDGCDTAAEGCPQDVRVLTFGGSGMAVLTWRETANGATTIVTANLGPLDANSGPTAQLRVTARQLLPRDVEFLAFHPLLYGSALVSVRDHGGRSVTLSWSPYNKSPLAVMTVAGAATAVAQVPPNLPFANDGPSYVVAANDGLWTLRGSTSERLVEGEISRAVEGPDRRIYFQRRSGFKDDSRPEAYTPSQTAIEIFDPTTRLVTPFLMPSDGDWGHLTLHTIASIGGRSQILYSRLEDQRSEFGPEYGIIDRLYRRSLDGSDEAPVIPVAGYEWGTHTISYHDRLIVTTQSSE